jgi:hypothetical protein
MAHLGYGSFGFADFGLTSFVLCSKNINNHKGCFIRLTDNNSPEWKEREFFNHNYRFKPVSSDLSKIPGSPIAYWISEKTLSVFNNDTIRKTFFSGGRNKTHNDDEYLRFHWEIVHSSKWIAYAKGGAFRRWYGNIDHVVNWSEEARTRYQSQGGLLNKQFWNREGITWTIVTAYKSSYRVKPNDAIFSSVSPTIFNKQFSIDYNVLGFLNSVVAQHFIEILDPTLATNMKDVLALPYKEGIIDSVNILVNENISLSRADWDCFETSIDFKHHPLIPRTDLSALVPLCEISSSEISSSKISDHYKQWEQECEERFQTLKKNEEELNRIFIEIYGLQDELSPEVEDKDITVRRADKGREMRSLISYAIGCIFGRYSLDVEGLAYAGGEWDKAKYKTFIPDKGNGIIITDEVFFNVDIVSRFIDFIQTVYGEKNLEENLTFIALALNSAGRNSREILRNYFLNDFYKDHVKVYRKRPIYWLFDSGKDNGFKALIYLHRYDAFTTSNLRIDHLHQLQYAYESEIKYLKQRKEEQQGSFPPKSDKQLEKLQKQLRETKVYDAQIAHLADSRIEIDLDDGVKRNYEKVQTAREGKRYEVLGKI